MTKVSGAVITSMSGVTAQTKEDTQQSQASNHNFIQQQR